MSEPQSEAGGGEAAKPPPPSPLSGCYLLIVVGEPHSPEHKDIILQKIAKGFLSWDIQNAHVDLEKELESLTAQTPEGEEARNGERLIQYATENLVTEVLIHPQLNTLSQCIRNLLSSFTRHRHLIHAGYTFATSGSWILQDGTFSLADFIDAFQESEVQRVLRAYDNCVTVDVHCSPEGDWTTERMLKESFSKSCKVRINPDDTLTAGGVAIGNFTNYIAPFLVPASIEQLLEPSDVVGNIRFSHPTLYVFPGGQGDAALFGINGFNMLIDGGFNRKACSWDFARHLDRLDAVLMTRLNNANANGISAVLRRKKQSTVYPQIGHFFSNLQERRHAASPDGDKDRDPLLINLLDEGQEIVMNLRHLQLKPHPCYRDGNQAEPINLYHKVGHGKLDMYVVSPARDSREVKEFLAKWNTNDMRLFLPGKKDKDGFHFPVQNLVSICALLVWQPANPSDTITRILFPGSCPQHKIFEGLDKIRHLEFLKHAVCSTKSISPSTSAVAMTARTGGKQKSTPAVIDKILPGENMVKTPPKPLDIVKQPVVKAATIPVSGSGQTKPSTPVSATTTPTTTKAPPQAKPKVEKLTSKTEPPKSKTETNKILESEKHASKVEKHIEKVSEKTTKLVKEAKSKEHKSKIESRTTVTKSRIDSKPPRSLERKKEKTVSEKKGDVKSSPTTPKRIVEHKVNGTATKCEVAKVSRTPSKGRPSPTSTPAKSAKEANNRKVVESKYHVARAASTTRAPITKATKKEQQDNVSVPLKPERKPISRRPKPSSPSKSSKAPGSPAKSSSAKSTPTPSVKSDKDGVIRKPKADIEKVATDSSTVSTPSTAEPETVPLKSKLAPEEIIPSTFKQITDVTSTALETSLTSDVNVETKLLESKDTSIKIKDKVLQKEDVIQMKVDETITEVRDFETEPKKVSKELTVAVQEEDEVTEDKESEVIEELEEKHITQDTEITEEERTEDIEDEDEILTEPGKTLEEEIGVHAQVVGKDVQDVEDEEDEYLIIEKEEVELMMEDSLQEEESTESHIPDQKEIEEYEGELQKHLRDEVESEKEKKFEELKEVEKEKVTEIGLIEKVKVTNKKETEIVKDEHQFQQAEKKYSKDEIEGRKESDTMIKAELAEPAVTEKVFTEKEILKTDKMTPETKEKIQEEVQEIISSAEEIATKTKIETEKIEDGIQERVKLLDESIDKKKYSEDLDDQKETSSISPEEKVDLSSEKLREMTEETRETDLKIDDHDESLPLKGTMQRDATDQKYTAEESQPDEKFSTTVESGATTAPTLPEDERIPLDEIKEIVEEKYVKEETKEEKPITVPVTSMDQPTALPHVVVPSTIGVFESRGPQSLLHQRDIVKTPDEVADLPVHEEVDTGMYESEDDFPKIKNYEREKKHIVSQVIMDSKQEIIDTVSKQHTQEIIPVAKFETSLQELVKKTVSGDKMVEEDMKKEINVSAPEIQKPYETVTKYDDDEKEKQQQEKKALAVTKEKHLADTKDEQPDTREIKYVGDVLKETEDQFKSDLIDEKDIVLVAKDMQESKNINVENIQDKTEDNITEYIEKVEPLEVGHIETKGLALYEKDKVAQGKEPEIKGTNGDQLIANIQFEDSVTSVVQHIKEKEVNLKEKDISSEAAAHEITAELTVEKKLAKILHDEADKGDQLPLESKCKEFFTEVKPVNHKEEKETIKEYRKLEAESFALTEISKPDDTTKDELIPADQKLGSITVEKHTVESHEEKSVFGVEDKIDKHHTQVDNKLLKDMLHAEKISKEPSTPKDFSQVHEESHTDMPVEKDEMLIHAEETRVSDILQSKSEKQGYKSIKDIDEMECSMEKLDSSEIHEVSKHKAEEHTAPVKEEPFEEVEEQDTTTVQSILQKAEDSIKQLTCNFIETERNLTDTDVIKEPSAAHKNEDTTKKLPDSEKLEISVKETGKEEQVMPDKDSEAKYKLLTVKRESLSDVKITEETLHDDSKVSKISQESENVSPEGTNTHEDHIYESRMESEGESKGQVEKKVDIAKDKTEAKKTELETAQIIEEQKTDRIGTQKDDKLSIIEVHKDSDTVKHEKMEDLAKPESTTKEERQLQQTHHDYEEFPAFKEKLQDVPKEITAEKIETLDTKYDKTIPPHEELETHEPGRNYIPVPTGKPVRVVPTEADSTAPGEISATYLEIIDKLQQKLPSMDEVSEVPKDTEDKKFTESGSDKLEYHKIAHTVDSLVSEVKEDECVTEDIKISHDKKILPSTKEKREKILAGEDHSLEHEPTKQVILETDTDTVSDHLPAQALPDLSAPESVKLDLFSTVSEDEAIGFQIQRISSDQKITELSTETRVSDKISESDSDSDDDLKGTRSLKITREAEKETIEVDIKKLGGDKRETVDSKDFLETVTKEVDDDLGRDYEGDVEEDEEDDDYVGSEYVDSGLEEEPVYSKLAAAAVPEYVTVTPDSAPPSPGDHRIPERTRDVLIRDKEEKISHIITDGSKVSLVSGLEKSDKDIPEKKQDIKEDKTLSKLEDKQEKESGTGDKLNPCITVAETGIKDTEVYFLQDQVVSGMSTPQSSESGQLLADAKSESGISTPHSIESNKTHEMKGELDSYKHDSEESTHELKSPTTVFTSKQMYDDHQNDDDELRPSSSKSPESIKISDNYKFTSVQLATELTKIDDHTKFFKHETGEASILDEVERESDDRLQDVSQKFISSERGISVNALRETDTKIYDISFQPVDTSKASVEKQVTPATMDMNGEYKEKGNENEKLLPTQFDKETVVSERVSSLTKSQMSKVEELKSDEKPCASAIKVDKCVEKEPEKIEKKTLFEILPSKEDTKYSLVEEKFHTGVSVAELDDLGRKSSGISESEISDEASLVSTSHEIEMKSKEECVDDVLLTDSAATTTVSQQSQQDISSSSTVRRMVVTASSEDGGAETEVCSSESLTVTSSQYSDNDKSTQKQTKKTVDSTPDIKDELENKDTFKDEPGTETQKTVTAVIKTSETNGHIYSSDKEDYESSPDDEDSRKSKKTIITKTVKTKTISHTDVESALVKKEHGIEGFEDTDDRTVTKVTKSTIISNVASDLEDSLKNVDEKLPSHEFPEEPEASQIVQTAKELEPLYKKLEDHKTVYHESQEHVTHKMVPEAPKITTTSTTTLLTMSPEDDIIHIDEPSSHYGSQESVAYETVLGSPKITTKTTTTTTTVLKKSLGDDTTIVDDSSSHYESQESLSHEVAPGSPKITTKTTTTTVLKKLLGDDTTIVDEPSSHYGSQESISHETVPGSHKITTKTTTAVLKKSIGDDTTIVDEPSSHYGSQESVSHETVPGSPKITKKTITTTTTTTVIKKSVGDEFTVVDEPSSHVGSQESVSHETVPGSPKITMETTTTVLKKSLGDVIMLVDEPSSQYGSHESVSHETVPGSPKITRKTITTTTVIKKALGDDITTTDEPSSHCGSEQSVSHETVPASPTITKKTTTTTTVLKKSLGDDITLVDEPSSHYGSEESVSHDTVPGSPTITKKTTTTTTVLKKSLGDDITLEDGPPGKTVTTTVTTATKKVSGDEEETTTTTTKEIDSDGERIITKTVEKDGKVTEHFSVVDKVGDGFKECDTQELYHDGLFKSADRTVDSAAAISELTAKSEKYLYKVTDITSQQAPLEDKPTKLYEEKTTISEKDGIRSSTVTTVTKTLTKELGDIDFPAFLSSGVTVIKREATDTVRSGTPGSDTFSDRDIEYGGPSTPHSDISSGQVSRAPTHIWGESSEGRPDSDDEDRPGSPLSTSSQLGHSPPPHFEDVTSDNRHPNSTVVMTGSFYGSLPEDPLKQLLQEHTAKKVSDPIPITGAASGKTEDVITKTALASSFKSYSPQDSTSAEDTDFEKALHEHWIARGEDFTPKTSTVTYGFESKSSPGHTYKTGTHQSPDVNGQKHYDDDDSDFTGSNLEHERELMIGHGIHDKLNGKPSIECTSVTTYHKTAEPSSSVKKVTTTTTTITSGEKHDPIFHHQTSSSLSSTFPEPPQGFGLPATKAEDLKDPIEGWGKPLGLPAPIPPPTNDTDTSAEIVASTPSNKGTPKKEKKSSQTKKTMLMNENNKIKDSSNKKRPESPVKQGERKGSSANKDTGLRNAKATGSPIYVDLTYVPHHGNSYYSSVEFFKKVRARYYVFSGTDPSRDVYNALLEAKQTWDDKELEVTIIPTYDTDTLGYWVAENEDTLAKCKIDLSPSASRCTINLQDHETSCSAYRLEF